MKSIFDTVLIIESIFAEGEAFILNADGSASFANGDLTIDTAGNLVAATLSFDAGQITSDGYGDLSIYGFLTAANGAVTIGGNYGNTWINTDGSASLAGGAFTISNNGQTQLQESFSCDYGAFSTDGDGNVTANTYSLPGGAFTVDSGGDVYAVNGQVSLYLAGGRAPSMDFGGAFDFSYDPDPNRSLLYINNAAAGIGFYNSTNQIAIGSNTAGSTAAGEFIVSAGSIEFMDGAASIDSGGNFSINSLTIAAVYQIVDYNGNLYFNGSSSDPHVAGQIWSNAGVLTVSGG